MTGAGTLCRVRTAKGLPCINPAVPGLGCCAAHDFRNLCTGRTVTGQLCRRMKSFGTDRCSKHQR